jgi:putative membrane-bound dehydrogenase-like protein
MSRLIPPSLLVFLLILTSALAQIQPPTKAAADKFPEPYNSGSEKGKTPPMSAANAVAAMKLPPGFRAIVFAEEPDVRNPIAMAWDERGRMWVAENYTYAESGVRYDLKLRDRIVIFEGQLADGRFATRKVFYDELQKLTSIAIGYGGVWVMCPPKLLFIPDRNGDDVPDGPPEVVLDGFTIPGGGIYHTLANGLRFGPDGWLYGRCGHSSPGQLGMPGTPAAERVPLRGGMWRYHPVRKVVEVLSRGLVNPWGHDWDEHGELFFINTIIGHLWHQITGAHYASSSKDPNPRVYQPIDMHADHWHFSTSKQKGLPDGSGGGHLHSGMMIYLGDNWPADYRGGLFTINMFGHRVNHEILERSGSGYVAHHGQDMIFVTDPWFRGLEISYGPDGGVFIFDWSDTGDFHDHSGVHRESGRIYKITHGNAKPSEVGDVAKLSVDQLVKLHSHRNEWFPRQVRMELIQRSSDGRGLGTAVKQLRELFATQNEVVVKLRALWTLYDIGATDQDFLRAQLRHPNEHVRAWAIRLLTDTWPLDDVLSKRPAQYVTLPEAPRPDALVDEFVRMAADDASGLVRLVLGSTLQRLPVSQRTKLAVALVSRKEDATDHNLPLLIWYGLIPVADSDPAALATLAGRTELRATRKFIARCLVEQIDRNAVAVNVLLECAMEKPEAFQVDILDGMSQGLKGVRKATRPAAWDALAKMLAGTSNLAARDRVRELSVIFGSTSALDEARKLAVDQKADMDARKAALEVIVNARPADLRQLCEQLLKVRFLNPIAARGLATLDDPLIGPLLVAAYMDFDPAERGQLVAILTSRSAFAAALLGAVADKKIARADISAYDARQIQSFKDAGLNKKLTEVWGELRASPADKLQLVAKLKAQLTPGVLAKADKSQGRMLFNKVCATCHTLYGEGAKVGPDLTGGGRGNLDFLLAKVSDPSAAVSADFRMSVLTLKDGRVLTGLIVAKTERTLTLKTATDALTVELGEIESTRESSSSLMPDGLLEALSLDQSRDLIAYLMDKNQAQLPSKKAP